MNRILIFIVVLVTMVGVAPLAAQDEAAQVVQSPSGRIGLTLPEGWVANTDAATDVQQIFSSEALTIAQDAETLEQVAFGPNIGGSHMVFATFPTLEVYPFSPNPTDFDEVANTLFGNAPGEVERFEVSGFPAVTLAQPNGIGFTVIGMGASMIGVSYQAVDAEGETAIDAIFESLTLQADGDPSNWNDSFTESLTTPDGRLSFEYGTSWYSGSRGATLYASPLASSIQDYAFNLMELGGLQAPLIAVVPRSYSEFFAPDEELSNRDLQTILDITLGEFGAFADGGFTPVVFADFAAVETNVTIGNNIGQAIAIDAQHTIYVIIGLYDAAQADLAAPITEQIFASVTIEPLSPEIAALPAEGLREGYRAPAFNTRLLTGEEINLRDLQGQVVMINFWFTTCPPCQEEMPAMQRAYDTYADQGFTILAVNNREIPAQIQPFLDSLGVDFPIGLDVSGAIQNQYGIFAYPTSIFIDGNGVIYSVQGIPLTDEEMTELIETGLARQ